MMGVQGTGSYDLMYVKKKRLDLKNWHAVLSRECNKKPGTSTEKLGEVYYRALRLGYSIKKPGRRTERGNRHDKKKTYILHPEV